MDRRIGIVAAALVPFVAGMIAGCGGSSNGDALSSNEVFERAQAGTVQLVGRFGDAVQSGTGVVVDADKGLVLTNAHVVNGVGALQARFDDQQPVPARTVGASFCDDLAVVHLEQKPDGIRSVPIGDSDTVENQDPVTALGYPGNFEDLDKRHIQSTSGNVEVPKLSATPSASLPTYPEVIQHSATINHGNSGGPLLNDRAELIGINTLTNSGTQSQQVQGQYYAITSNHAKQVLDSLEKGDRTDNAGWDVDAFRYVPLEAVFPAVGFGTAEQGAQVDQVLQEKGIDGLWVWGVTPGSPAEQGQVESGDLITSVNGVNVRSVPDLCSVLDSSPPGSVLTVDGISIVNQQHFLEPFRVQVKLPG